MTYLLDFRDSAGRQRTLRIEADDERLVPIIASRKHKADVAVVLAVKVETPKEPSDG
jgi:hypothetical protein